MTNFIEIGGLIKKGLGHSVVDRFSKNIVDGAKGLVCLLGGKGANLVKIFKLNIPVTSNLTISSEMCNCF